MGKALYLILGLVIAVAGCGRAQEEESPLEIPQVDSTQLKQTRITSVLDEPVVSGTNLVYCSTFQLAWNELKDGIIKEDIRMKDEPPLVGLLNRGLASKKDISDSAYVAMAGFGKDGIVDKINQALKSKFQDQAPVVREDLEPIDILAYAFLYKNLKFKYIFGKLKYEFDFRGSSGITSVKAFGIDNRRLPDYEQVAKQVSILDYQNDDDFIIRLLTDSADDEVVLAKINPGKTISETVLTVLERIKKGTPAAFGENDKLSIPKIDFNVRHSYKELLDKDFTNKDWHDYFIRKALQSIRFRLNERGVILKSETKIFVEYKCLPPVHRQLFFDKPFLIYLKEKGGKSPYFVMWVDNPELLVKY
ncbi:MAG: hypothetical protein WC980_02095 [Candidatus Brocadiia bacterium]